MFFAEYNEVSKPEYEYMTEVTCHDLYMGGILNGHDLSDRQYKDGYAIWNFYQDGGHIEIKCKDL